MLSKRAEMHLSHLCLCLSSARMGEHAETPPSSSASIITKHPHWLLSGLQGKILICHVVVCETWHNGVFTRITESAKKNLHSNKPCERLILCKFAGIYRHLVATLKSKVLYFKLGEFEENKYYLVNNLWKYKIIQAILWMPSGKTRPVIFELGTAPSYLAQLEHDTIRVTGNK